MPSTTPNSPAGPPAGTTTRPGTAPASVEPAVAPYGGAPEAGASARRPVLSPEAIAYARAGALAMRGEVSDEQWAVVARVLRSADAQPVRQPGSLSRPA